MAEALWSYDVDSLAGNDMERAFENWEKSLPKTAKFLMSAMSPNLKLTLAVKHGTMSLDGSPNSMMNE